MSRLQSSAPISSRFHQRGGSLGVRSDELVFVVYKSGARVSQKKVVAERHQQEGLVKSIGMPPEQEDQS